MLFDYSNLAQELKIIFLNNTEEKLNEVTDKYKRIEKKVEKCNFSQKVKKTRVSSFMLTFLIAF